MLSRLDQLRSLFAGSAEGGAPGADFVDPTWDTTSPRGRAREIDFVTDVGTWMSVDLSPDGRWIVFDLLGHIYRMASSGGEAECLTQASGVALNFHPAISLDGDRIAFISDRHGQNGLWVMDLDGSDPRQVFMDPSSRIAEPSWLPDGSGIIAVRAFPTPGRAWHRQNTRLWAFPLDGGDPFELLGDEHYQFNAPAPATDGTVFFHTSAFSGNRYGTQVDHCVQKVPPGRTGREDVVAFNSAPLPEESGGGHNSGSADRTNKWAGLGAENDKSLIPEDAPAAIQPRPSPDGRWLAYAREVERLTTVEGHSMSVGTDLFVRDLNTGEDRRIAPMTRDLSGAHAMYSYRVLPGYAWSAGSDSIVFSEGGKIRRVDVASGLVSTIPFTARVRRTISEQVRGRHRIDDERFAPALLQWPASSPDGRSVAFVTDGRVWTATLPGGLAAELRTDASGLKMTPSWSPSGREIAYVSWDDLDRGHVWIQPLGGEARRVTDRAGEYIFPSFSPDGRWLLVTRGASENEGWQKWASSPSWEVVLLPVEGGRERVLANTSGPRAACFADDGRIHFEHQQDRQAAQGLFAPFPDERARGATVSVRSVDVEGKGEKIHVTLPARTFAFGGSNIPLLSPDGRLVAFQAARDVYVADVADVDGGPSPTIDPYPGSPAFGKRRLSRTGGIFHRWRGTREVEFFDGRDHVVVDAYSGEEKRTTIAVTLRGNAPSGRLVLANARIIPVNCNEVIERGTIVVDDGRITYVGQKAPPPGGKIVDLSGKTVIPGFVDVHSHTTHLPYGIVPNRIPMLGVQLAYGVTTTVDPATDSASAFPLQDLVATGKIRGPRIFSVGELINAGPATGLGGDQLDIRSFEDAQRHAQRRRNWGAVGLKNFRLTSRDQIQKLIEAARQSGLSVTAEGGPVEFNIGMAMDGQTGWEHYIDNLPIYSDVSRFLGMAGVTYSPTVGCAGHARGALDFWRARHDLSADRKYRSLVPEDMIPTSADLTAIRPASEFTFPVVAAGLSAIRRAGGYGAIGEHSEQSGIGSHWEVWSYATAMSQLEALRMASLEGARFHGLEEDVGSIEVGKLADLLILNSNPLDDIRNTLDIFLVVLGGRFYDHATADEIWPDRRPYGPLPWRCSATDEGGAYSEGGGLEVEELARVAAQQ